MRSRTPLPQRQQAHWGAFLDLNAPVKGTPGEAFEYNSMNTYLLSAIIQERTGMKMVDYLRPRLFEPLGIRKVFWESCPAGITKGGWGLFLCPEDAAKLGVMYVNGGKFEGKQIVPAEWVAASTSVHATPPEKMGKYGYGYQVWMEAYAHTGAMVNLYARGQGADKFRGVYDNTEIFHKLAELTDVQ